MLISFSHCYELQYTRFLSPFHRSSAFLVAGKDSLSHCILPKAIGCRLDFPCRLIETANGAICSCTVPASMHSRSIRRGMPPAISTTSSKGWRSVAIGGRCGRTLLLRAVRLFSVVGRFLFDSSCRIIYYEAVDYADQTQSFSKGFFALLGRTSRSPLIC